jgi:CRISPR-associated protein Csm1
MVSERSRRLAFLLYDIGALRSRIGGGSDTDDATEAADGTEATDGTADTTIEHGRQSVEFLREHIDDEDAARLVEAYHSDGDSEDLPEDLRRDTLVLRAASRLAAPTVEKGHSTPPPGEPERTRLSSVFAPLRDSSDPATSEMYPLRPLALDRDTLFPRSDSEYTETIDEGYRRLWDGLTGEIRDDAAYETVVHLLEKYTWCVPSDAGSADLPLYDRLRTTAAIAEALHRSEFGIEDLQRLADGQAIDGELFTLVKGDISGIQAFLHRMRNPDDAQDRVSKRMRGRSTQLWLLNEGLNRLFLRRLGLPVTSMIWSGGGQFYALVPASTEASIEEFETEVNSWLLDRFNGDLFFILGRADAQPDDAEAGFATLFGRVASDADARKLQKGAPSIAALDSPIIGEPTEPCAACGGAKDRDADRCNECNIQEEIGRRLPRATHLCLDGAESADAHFVLDLPEGGLSWRFVEPPEEAECLYSLNTTDMVHSGSVSGFMFTGAAVPAGGGVDRVWSFSEQAGLGRSDADLLHVSKMDIDGLGNAIATGMEGGLARLAALSRSLELFFSGHVNEIADGISYLSASASGACEDCQGILAGAETREVDHRRGERKTAGEETAYYRPESGARRELHDSCVERISPVYIGFSGGDDMFFVGPWDETITFGRAVREAFGAYTGGSLTLSAGFFLTQPKYPIGRGAENAEERLAVAKEFAYAGTAKNAAALFGETIGWELDDYPGMDALVEFGQRFEELLDEEKISKATLYSLLDLRDEEYRRGVDPDDVSVGTEREWRFKYLLARNVDRAVMDELEESVPRALPWITVPVSWASLATR